MDQEGDHACTDGSCLNGLGMGLPDRRALVARVCPPLDPTLAGQMVDEFVGMEKRYIQRDWKPAELDGGTFCEALARILYHQDSANLNFRKEFSECLDYVEDGKGQLPHAITPRSDALHMARVLRSVYKLRSQRGVAHLSTTYDANQMDSRLIVENVRWCMNESLRMFGAGDREEIARIVRELLRFEVPCIGKYGDILLVQRTDLTAEEEVLLLLHYAGEAGFTRRDLGRHLKFFSASSVTGALRKLEDARQVVALPGGRWCLGDRGAKRVREELADKLLTE